jgi:hypothetical protein
MTTAQPNGTTAPADVRVSVRAAGAVNTRLARRSTPIVRSCPAPVGEESAGLVGCRADRALIH